MHLKSEIGLAFRGMYPTVAATLDPKLVEWVCEGMESGSRAICCQMDHIKWSCLNIGVTCDGLAGTVIRCLAEQPRHVCFRDVLFI